MQLNLTTDYAIRCILYLDGKKGPVPAKEICEFADVGKPYGYRVLHLLKEAGIVDMKMGANGGFNLLVPIDKVSLLEIMKTTEDTVKINKCLEDEVLMERNEDRRPRIPEFFKGLQSYMEDILGNIFVSDMAEGQDMKVILKRIKKTKA